LEAKARGEAPPGLAKGNAAYFVPDTMVLGKASRVDLWIDGATSLEQLQADLAKRLNISRDRIKVKTGKAAPEVGQVVGISDVFVGAKMTARLRGGDDFAIEPAGPVTKSLDGDNRAMWDWRVTPKKSDSRGLVLYIDAWVEMGANKDAFPSIDETIIVQPPPPPSFWERIRNWLTQAASTTDLLNKLLTGLGVVGGLGGAFAAIRKWFKRDKTVTA
jgi:hypothetical protein